MVLHDSTMSKPSRQLGIRFWTLSVVMGVNQLCQSVQLILVPRHADMIMLECLAKVDMKLGYVPNRTLECNCVTNMVVSFVFLQDQLLFLTTAPMAISDLWEALLTMRGMWKCVLMVFGALFVTLAGLPMMQQ